MDLNVKDRKILAELDLNARATFQEIGNKTGLSKESALYRVKNLERKGIIQRYATLVNFSKLGYTGYAVFNRFQNVTEETKTGIVEYLSGIPELYWIGIVGGRYDLAFAVMCKSVVHFNRIYYGILTKYGRYLADSRIAIRTELRQHKRKYLVSEEPGEYAPPFFGKEPEVEELDELDSSILSLMSNNARISTVELAALLKKPASTVALRVKQLEKRAVIQGYTTYIKAQKFGMQSYRLLIYLENMDERSRKMLFSYVHSNPKMILGMETVGEWNFEITLEVESHGELQQEIAKLRDSLNKIIRNVEFLIMFEDDLVYDPYPLKKEERKRLLAGGR